MARPGITADQVCSAAEAIAAEGNTPTVQTIRARIGSGSFSTIAAFLEQWRADQNDRSGVTIPDPPEAVTRHFREVWAVAYRTNRDGLTAERQALDAERQNMAAERAEMATEIRTLEQALQKVEAQAHEQQQRAEAAEAEGIRLTAKLEAAEKAGEAFRADLEKERQARVASAEQAARLEEAVQRLTQQLEAERARVVRLEERPTEASVPKGAAKKTTPKQ